MAAVQAGIENILILYCDDNLSREKEVAMQLSHNAISGQDDLAILKSLWDEINTIGFKEYVGFDDNFIEKLDGMEFVSIKESPVEYKQVIFLFLPEEMEKLKQWLDEFAALYEGQEIFSVKRKDYDLFFRTIARSKKLNGIINNTVALMTILEMVESKDEKNKLN